MLKAVLTGLTLGFALALSVGPIIFTIIKQSLDNGHKGGFSFVAGVWISDILLVVLSNTLTAVVSSLDEHKKVVGALGGSFLILMGLYFAFFKKVTLAKEADGPQARFRKRDMARIFASGFIINTLNPGVIFFWLGNTTLMAARFTLNERILVFSVCLFVNMGADVLKVMMADKLRSRLTVKMLSIINKIAGALLVIFGVALAYDVLFLHRISTH
ncbi:MAG TPA: LysE family transporter [Puia sp.]|uniref:LysE family translocator n=1 Tax=Puia sp. TaxID=2045100 RepID=UPI002D0F3D21|nr:LysE family transporter [Puia sp.]HVU97238.1 LysE family transporter [Puia sp.]